MVMAVAVFTGDDDLLPYVNTLLYYMEISIQIFTKQKIIVSVKPKDKTLHFHLLF